MRVSEIDVGDRCRTVERRELAGAAAEELLRLERERSLAGAHIQQYKYGLVACFAEIGEDIGIVPDTHLHAVTQSRL